jgi:methylthioribose-1-phosphate isomerase
MIPAPIGWTPAHAIRILDQTLLPTEERYLVLDTVDAVGERRSACCASVAHR